ncbi:MAG: hypothetical protein NDJ72_09000, partial [Elusimicrobia bacterium]|nr:hypothetical protein [Elusimicrobiota bacterium]
TPRLKAAKVPLPARLTRVPRALKKTPAVPAPAAASAPAIMTVGRTPRPIRSFSRPIGNHEPHGSSLFSGKGFTVAAVQGNGRPSHGGVMPILTMAIMAFAVLFFIRRG